MRAVLAVVSKESGVAARAEMNGVWRMHKADARPRPGRVERFRAAIDALEDVS